MQTPGISFPAGPTRARGRPFPLQAGQELRRTEGVGAQDREGEDRHLPHREKAGAGAQNRRRTGRKQRHPLRAATPHPRARRGPGSRGPPWRPPPYPAPRPERSPEEPGRALRGAGPAWSRRPIAPSPAPSSLSPPSCPSRLQHAGLARAPRRARGKRGPGAPHETKYRESSEVSCDLSGCQDGAALARSPPERRGMA